MARNATIHFEISERRVLLRLFDLISVFVTLYAIGAFFQFDYFTIDVDRWEWVIVLAIYLSVFGTIFELYDLQKASNLFVTFKNIILTSSITILFYLLTPFFTPNLPQNRLQILLFFAAIVVALFVWRWAYIGLISSPRFYKRIILFAPASDIPKMTKAIEKSDPNYKVVGFVRVGNGADVIYESRKLMEFTSKNLEEAIYQNGISEIIVSGSISKKATLPVYSKLLELLEKGFSIKEYVQVYEELTHRVPIHHVDEDFYRYFPFSRSNQNKLYLFFHTITNVVLSVIGLVFGITILPFILLGNALANRGPLFYFQERVGKNGKPFFIIKLRSMIENAEPKNAVWATPNDSRTTPFGKFLRKTRIDEIPQFINVLKGDMSVIGPRPERPYFVKELSKEIPFYEVRHIIKPGLTGWAQVNSDYAASKEDALEKLQYDLYYIKKRSLFLDANILLKTLSTILFYRGY